MFSREFYRPIFAWWRSLFYFIFSERPELNREALLHVGEQFTEIFIKKSDNVGLILGFMEEYEFQVRWPAVKLLTTLLANK